MNDPSFTPPDAPRRPIIPQFSGCLFGGIVVSAFVYIVVQAFSNQKNGWVAAGVLFGLTVVHIVINWMKSDRLGWYELKPIQYGLPFQYGGVLLGNNYQIVFDDQDIRFANRYRALYTQITYVETLCENILLTGVTIYFSDGYNEAILNYQASGEPVRTIIALLRQKAPHAQFIGPRWVGDGYVPRGGFNSVDSDGPAGNGP